MVCEKGGLLGTRLGGWAPLSMNSSWTCLGKVQSENPELPCVGSECLVIYISVFSGICFFFFFFF